ncbi:MAG: carboxypeptidase-like regulatory domain-containing protein, partial [Candidatus Acidiferrales bacterium]
MQTIWMKRSVALAFLVCGFLLAFAKVRTEARPRSSAAIPQVSVDSDNIGGVVTSANGPEGGVWVIAETTLGTKFRKEVVTNDQGQYLLPQLPNATYKVWVRGYGLVDSPAVEATPGKVLNLTAVIAPTPQAAAQYYPADYWFSILTSIPPKSAFPMTIQPSNPLPGPPDPVKLTHGSPPPPRPVGPTTINTQGDYIQAIKSCGACHQAGVKASRELSPLLAPYGPFKSSEDAWVRMLSAGQLGRASMLFLERLNRENAIKMYADWGDRIAKGEVPPAPPRPQGI